MLEFYSEAFSLYPFWEEKYGHCLAPMGGGMEHQTMTTLSSFRFNLVAHELTHQWYGDDVTCASWQDIWINEGFASYGEYLAQEALISKQEADGWMLNAHEWAKSEPEGSVYIPLEDATSVWRIFSMALSYKKGAALLHMIRYELDNDSLFFETLQEFSAQYSDSVASGEDFREVLENVSGMEFEWFFEQWYYGQGYPQFAFTWSNSEDSLILDIRQQGSSAETPVFKTSLDIKLYLEDGNDTTIRVWVDKGEMLISTKVPAFVSDISIDPANWVLETSEIIKADSSDGLYTVSPNPFTDELVIRFKNGQAEREIYLTDMGGKTVLRQSSESERLSLDTHFLSPGLYILQVNENKNSYTTRVVKQ